MGIAELKKKKRTKVGKKGGGCWGNGTGMQHRKVSEAGGEEKSAAGLFSD